MPGKNGVELGKKIPARWPDRMVVLTSGYSHELTKYSGDGFPLRPQVLFGRGIISHRPRCCRLRRL